MYINDKPVTQQDLVAIIRQAVKDELTDYKTRPAQSPSEWFTIEEAGAYLNLARATLYGLVHHRQIPFCKRGKRLYFKRSDLANWIGETRKRSVKEIEAHIKVNGTI